MCKRKMILALLVFMLFGNQLLGQHINLLEIKPGGGLVSERDKNTINPKGFTIVQESEKKGVFFSLGLSTHSILRLAETSYNLRILSFGDAVVQQPRNNTEIAAPIQRLRMVQNYVGATYYPFSDYTSRFSPFIYVGLGYNQLKLYQKKGDVTATTPLDGNTLPTVVRLTLPSTRSSLGAFGYEAALGFKYLDTEKIGFFLQARFNQVLQNQTESMSATFKMYQLEGGLIIRTLKRKRSFLI